MKRVFCLVAGLAVLSFSVPAAATAADGQGSNRTAAATTTAHRSYASTTTHSSRSSLDDVPPTGTVTPNSAVGFQPISSFDYRLSGVDIHVPTGCFLDHTIKGSSTYISQEYAGVSCVGPAGLPATWCNLQFAFVSEDTSGNTWQIERTPVYQHCYTGNTIPEPYYPDYNLGPSTQQGARWTLPGKACVVLKVNGSGRATQCHYITP